jgi:hypothetical protein
MLLATALLWEGRLLKARVTQLSRRQSHFEDASIGMTPIGGAIARSRLPPPIELRMRVPGRAHSPVRDSSVASAVIDKQRERLQCDLMLRAVAAPYQPY